MENKLHIAIQMIKSESSFFMNPFHAYRDGFDFINKFIYLNTFVF